MNTKTMEIYTCDYCRKYYKLKRFAIQHEIKCRKNPDNFQKCFDSCIHLNSRYINRCFFDHNDAEHWKRVRILFCEKKKTGVYPYWISHPYMEENLEGNLKNNAMPAECECWE